MAETGTMSEPLTSRAGTDADRGENEDTNADSVLPFRERMRRHTDRLFDPWLPQWIRKGPWHWSVRPMIVFYGLLLAGSSPWAYASVSGVVLVAPPLDSARWIVAVLGFIYTMAVNACLPHPALLLMYTIWSW